MTDLFHVPGDTGGDWRFKKMVQYISDFPDEIGPIMNEYMRVNNATPDDKIWWVFLYSTCYCMGTALLLTKMLDFRTCTEEDIDKLWNKERSTLIFQSDRRWVRSLNKFKQMVLTFLERCHRKPYEYIQQFVTDDPEKTYNNLYSEIENNLYYNGRFGTILFIFNLCKLFPEIKVESKVYDWETGATTTSALFHVLYEDEKAINFEKRGKEKYNLTKEDIDILYENLYKVIDALKEYHPSKDWNIVWTASDLCSFRKLFKQSRYPGFYVDRQMAEIKKLSKNYPEYSDLWDFVWISRQKFIDHKYLGEIYGWDGPRSGLTDRFLKTGRCDPIVPEVEKW